MKILLTCKKSFPIRLIVELGWLTKPHGGWALHWKPK